MRAKTKAGAVPEDARDAALVASVAATFASVPSVAKPPAVLGRAPKGEGENTVAVYPGLLSAADSERRGRRSLAVSSFALEISRLGT